MALNSKNLIFFLILSLNLIAYSNISSNDNNDFFISGSYDNEGLKINYSASINVSLPNSTIDNPKLTLQLNSFSIEEATSNNTTYRAHDIFGISFPFHTTAEITSKLQLSYNGISINKDITFLPNKKTYIDLDNNITDLSVLKIKSSKTLSIKSIFIDEIKKAIKNNSTSKTSEEKTKEYSRLNELGNEYLSRNNYSQAISAYLKAKKYTNKNSIINTQITDATNQAIKDNVTVNTEGIALNTVDKTYYIKEVFEIPFNTEIAPNKLVPIEKEKVITNKQAKQVKSTKDEEIEYEYEYEAEVVAQPKATDSEYEYDEPKTKQQNTAYINTDDIEYEYEYEYENGAPNIDETNNYKKGGIKKVFKSNSTQEKESSSNVFKPIKTQNNFIKYKQNQQAVTDSKGNILIPYGQYEILQYTAGFAHVKIKDYVTTKNITNNNKNDEYFWSTSIHENPWKETVIDKNGNFVNDIIKKVEIYIIDNINNTDLPNNYVDHNNTQIAANNLWNQGHSNDINIIEKRKEIERLKTLSKNEACNEFEKCHEQVLTQFKDVYDYYVNAGYEVILKETLTND